MKKKVIAILCAAVIIIGTAAIAYASGLLTKKPIFNEATGQYDLTEDYTRYIEDRVLLSAENISLENVPVYKNNDLLHNTDHSFYLGRDSGFYSTVPNTRQDLAKVIFAAFPTDAIRQTPDKSGVYAVYDTDIGIRLYLFFSNEKNNYMTLDGFPVIMQKKLSFGDFENIRTGDSIRLVEAIDPIVSQYISFFDTGTDEALEGYAHKGAGAASVHLLTDGILKIEYKRNKDDYVITNIVYNEDFVLEGLCGKTCYEISELDYVK